MSTTDAALGAVGVMLAGVGGVELADVGGIMDSAAGLVTALSGAILAWAALARARRAKRTQAARCGAAARYFREGAPGEPVREVAGSCDRPKGHRGRHVAGEGE